MDVIERQLPGQGWDMTEPAPGAAAVEGPAGAVMGPATGSATGTAVGSATGTAVGSATGTEGRGRAGVLPTVALLAACLVIIDTGIGILPGDALSTTLPVLNVLTTQRVILLLGIISVALAAPRPSTFATVVDVPVVLLLALAGYSSLQAAQSDPLQDWRRLLTAVLAMYLVVAVIRCHPDAVPAIATAVLAAAFVAAATAVSQYTQGTDSGFYRQGLTNTETPEAGAFLRSIGTFSNPNLLAGYLIMALPLVVALLWHAAIRAVRVGAIVLSALCILGLVVTFSRAATFAAVVVAVGAVVVIGLHRRLPTLLVPAAAIGVLMATALLLGSLATGLFARLSGRSDLWEAALAAARQGGVDGVGYGRAGAVMTALSQQPGVGYAHTHNLLLNWLVDVGPLGPLVVTALLALAIVAGARRAAAGSLLAAGAVASLAAVSIASLTDHPTTLARNLVMLFVVIACAVAVAVPGPESAGRHLVAGTSRPAGTR